MLVGDREDANGSDSASDGSMHSQLLGCLGMVVYVGLRKGRGYELSKLLMPVASRGKAMP